jgi:hypothetical protein
MHAVKALLAAGFAMLITYYSAYYMSGILIFFGPCPVCLGGLYGAYALPNLFMVVVGWAVLRAFKVPLAWAPAASVAAFLIGADLHPMIRSLEGLVLTFLPAAIPLIVLVAYALFRLIPYKMNNSIRGLLQIALMGLAGYCLAFAFGQTPAAVQQDSFTGKFNGTGLNVSLPTYTAGEVITKVEWQAGLTAYLKVTYKDFSLTDRGADVNFNPPYTCGSDTSKQAKVPCHARGATSLGTIIFVSNDYTYAYLKQGNELEVLHTTGLDLKTKDESIFNSLKPQTAAQVNTLINKYH